MVDPHREATYCYPYAQEILDRMGVKSFSSIEKSDRMICKSFVAVAVRPFKHGYMTAVPGQYIYHRDLVGDDFEAHNSVKLVSTDHLPHYQSHLGHLVTSGDLAFMDVVFRPISGLGV